MNLRKKEDDLWFFDNFVGGILPYKMEYFCVGGILVALSQWKRTTHAICENLIDFVIKVLLTFCLLNKILQQ